MGVNEHYTTLLYLSLTIGIVTPYLDSFLTPSPTSAIVSCLRSQPSSSLCIPVIASMTSTLGRPSSWMSLKGNGGDLTGMQNITSSLLKGLIGGGAFLGVPRVNRDSAYAEQFQPECDLLPPRLSRHSGTGQVISLPFFDWNKNAASAFYH